MPKDPDIKSNSKTPAKAATAANTKQKAGAKSAPESKLKASAKPSAKQLSFKDKLSKIGVKKGPSKKTITAVGVGSLVALVLTIAVFGVMIYKYKSANRAVKIASKVIPYPVASVNGNYIFNTASYNEYLFELASIQKFYQSQGQDLTTEEGKVKLAQLKNDIITQLEDNEIINQQAAKYGIKVSSKEVQEQFDTLVKEAGGIEKVKTTLDKLYGWTVEDFKAKINQSIIQKKLAEKILADDKLNDTAKSQAEDLKKQIDAGADFAELAKKFSGDEGSASNNGDLGLIIKGQTVPEFEAAAYALEPGQVSAVIKTQFGYHIIKVTGKEGDQVRASHILIKGVDIQTWLRDQRAKSQIRQYFYP